MYDKEEISDFARCKGIIYKVTNLTNNKCYIGQSRRTFNLRYAGKGVGSQRMNRYVNCYLQRAFDKYGVDNFKVELLEKGITDNFLLDEMEKHYICKFDSVENGYNFFSGGDTHKIPECVKWRNYLVKLKNTYISDIHDFNELVNHLETYGNLEKLKTSELNSLASSNLRWINVRIMQSKTEQVIARMKDFLVELQEECNNIECLIEESYYIK